MSIPPIPAPRSPDAPPPDPEQEAAMRRYLARLRAELEWRRQQTLGYWIERQLKRLRATVLPAWR